MLIASHLTRRFGARTAVEDLSFQLAPGEVFALLGPNGAGKTTTLRILAGLIAPTSGTVHVDGDSATREPSALRARIGFLTEAPGLWDRLTVRNNLVVYARLHGLPHPHAAVDRALELFDIRERAQQPAVQLSKGLKQRVALARTLLHNPAILLLDEPTAGLDPESARDVRELVLRLRDERRSILVSTHNLDEVERIADRVAVLRTTFLAIDTPAALRARLFGARVRITLAQHAAQYAAVLSGIGMTDVRSEGATLSIDVGPQCTGVGGLVRALVEHGADIQEVVREEAPLEEVYLRLLNGERQA